jgi:ABC-type Fe3+-hydroxamate transport system substrate-binding protein
MSKPLFLILILLLLVPSAAAQDGFPRVVIDSTGQPVTIPARPEIVAVMGEIPALDALIPADRQRKIDLQSDPAAIDWSGIGLLVLPNLYAAAYPEMTASAAAAGVPVFQITLLSSLESWRDHVLRLGQALGCDPEAAALVERLDRRRAFIAGRVGALSPVRVVALTPEGYTFGQYTLLTDLITAAGGLNAAAAVGYTDYRQITDSTIRSLAPDMILLSPAWGTAAYDNGRVLPFSFTSPADPAAALTLLALIFHPGALLRPF